MKAERDRGNPYLMASVTSLKLAAGLLVQCEGIGGGGGGAGGGGFKCLELPLMAMGAPLSLLGCGSLISKIRRVGALSRLSGPLRFRS